MPGQTLAHSAATAIEHNTFSVELMEDRNLVPHLGSMLRGAFGHALRDEACCRKTPHAAACVYAAIFEPTPPAEWPKRFSDCPPAYVITPPSYGSVQGRHFQFSMTLLGLAPSFRDIIGHAWEQAGLAGLGSARVPARIHRVQRSTLPPFHSPGKQLSLRINTPMLLKQHSRQKPRHYRLAANEVTFDAIVRALHRRLELTHLLYGVPANPPPPLEHWLADSAALDCQANLHDVEFSRHSNRQHRDMPLAGVIGHLCISGPISTELLAALALGQWLHVGGKTSFGLGAYNMTFLDAPGVRLYLET